MTVNLEVVDCIRWHLIGDLLILAGDMSLTSCSVICVSTDHYFSPCDLLVGLKSRSGAVPDCMISNPVLVSILLAKSIRLRQTIAGQRWR
ncbi:hypothetical protein [Algoriphagus halophytocola]|uniref:Uncharacterized protein n=1 Tax=Algoriphagus halophytocola TaxID=2991499 RepID=A0ABY6MJB8_9BACT|nr:hypothetical protein [Algoriphagus sp. TR-M5]UZD23888.1 hypothetical protein OM944_05200 [Algoriphagus sp. TR-M5]